MHTQGALSFNHFKKKSVKVSVENFMTIYDYMEAMNDYKKYDGVQYHSVPSYISLC